MPKVKNTSESIKLGRPSIKSKSIPKISKSMDKEKNNHVGYSLTGSELIGSVATNNPSDQLRFYFHKDCVLFPKEVKNLFSFIPLVESSVLIKDKVKIYINTDLYGPGTFISNEGNEIVGFYRSLSYQFELLSSIKLNDTPADDYTKANFVILIKGWKNECYPKRNDDLNLIFAAIESLGGYIIPSPNKKALFLYSPLFNTAYHNSFPKFDLHTKLNFTLDDFDKPTDDLKGYMSKIDNFLQNDMIIAACVPKQYYFDAEKNLNKIISLCKEDIVVMSDKKDTNLATSLMINIQATGTDPYKVLKYFEQPSCGVRRAIKDHSRRFRVMIKPSGTQPNQLGNILRRFSKYFFTLINVIPFSFNTLDKDDTGTEAIRILYNGGNRPWRAHWENYLKSGTCLILTFTDNEHYNMPFDQSILIVRKIVKDLRDESNIIWTRNIAHCSEIIDEEKLFDDFETFIRSKNLTIKIQNKFDIDIFNKL